MKNLLLMILILITFGLAELQSNSQRASTKRFDRLERLIIKGDSIETQWRRGHLDSCAFKKIKKNGR